MRSFIWNELGEWRKTTKFILCCGCCFCCCCFRFSLLRSFFFALANAVLHSNENFLFFFFVASPFTVHFSGLFSVLHFIVLNAYVHCTHYTLLHYLADAVLQRLHWIICYILFDFGSYLCCKNKCEKKNRRKKGKKKKIIGTLSSNICTISSKIVFLLSVYCITLLRLAVLFCPVRSVPFLRLFTFLCKRRRKKCSIHRWRVSAFWFTAVLLTSAIDHVLWMWQHLSFFKIDWMLNDERWPTK